MMQVANVKRNRAFAVTLRVLDVAFRNLSVLIVGAIAGFGAALVAFIGLIFLGSVLMSVAAAFATRVGDAAWTVWAIATIVSFIATIIGGAVAAVIGTREMTRSLKVWAGLER